MKPFTLTVAPNGARYQKTDHPALPISIAETVDCAVACHHVGADEIHLHVRNTDGSHSLDAGLYREALNELNRAVPDMSVQITTESAGIFDVADQLKCLEDLRPKSASLAVREFARDPIFAKRAYWRCQDEGTKVQHILYTTDCVQQYLTLRAEGVIHSNQNSVIFVLGHYNPPLLAHPKHLDGFLDAIAGHDLIWSVCAFGKHEHACLRYAIQKGGNVRIGFENNSQRPDGTAFADNAASIATFIASL